MDSQESSPTPQLKSINSLACSLLYGQTLTPIHDYWKNCNFDYMDLCRQLRCLNIYPIRLLERENVETWAQMVYIEITPEIFPDLKENMSAVILKYPQEG